jgi:hypothetical protein
LDHRLIPTLHRPQNPHYFRPQRLGRRTRRPRIHRESNRPHHHRLPRNPKSSSNHTPNFPPHSLNPSQRTKNSRKQPEATTPQKNSE